MTNTIAFPTLGLEFQINRIAFTVLGKPIYWYALIILTGFITALTYACKSSKKRGISADNIFDIALYGLLSGIVFARIYYVIFDPDSLGGNILNIVKIWEGGIAIYGGIIGAVISTVIYCKVKKLPILKTFDICSVALILGQAIGRWGNFVNAEVFGRETDFFLGMSINGKNPVHPLFLYESLWNFLGFILLLFFQDKKKKDGDVFFSYLLWYSFGRLFLEGMRQSEYILYLIDSKLGISQLVSVLLIVVSISGFILIRKKK